jgi:DNA-binding response OmpR family regulator
MLELIPKYVIVSEAGIHIDLFSAKVTWNEEDFKMSLRSYSVLVLLASSPFSGFTIREIMEQGGFPSPAAAYNQIHHMRAGFNQKLIFSAGHSKYSLLSKG